MKDLLTPSNDLYRSSATLRLNHMTLIMWLVVLIGELEDKTPHKPIARHKTSTPETYATVDPPVYHAVVIPIVCMGKIESVNEKSLVDS